MCASSWPSSSSSRTRRRDLPGCNNTPGRPQTCMRSTPRPPASCAPAPPVTLAAAGAPRARRPWGAAARQSRRAAACRRAASWAAGGSAACSRAGEGRRAGSAAGACRRAACRGVGRPAAGQRAQRNPLSGRQWMRVQATLQAVSKCKAHCPACQPRPSPMAAAGLLAASGRRVAAAAAEAALPAVGPGVMELCNQGMWHRSYPQQLRRSLVRTSDQTRQQPTRAFAALTLRLKSRGPALPWPPPPPPSASPCNSGGPAPPPWLPLAGAALKRGEATGGGWQEWDGGAAAERRRRERGQPSGLAMVFDACTVLPGVRWEASGAPGACQSVPPRREQRLWAARELDVCLTDQDTIAVRGSSTRRLPLGHNAALCQRRIPRPARPLLGTSESARAQLSSSWRPSRRRTCRRLW